MYSPSALTRPFLTRSWPQTVLLVAAIIACFSPCLFAGFTNWDDGLNITGNPFINPPTLQGLARIWSAPYEGLYIPVVYTTYATELALAGPRPWLFHATNLVIHCVAVVLVWRILLLLLAGHFASASGTHTLLPKRAATITVAAIIGALLFGLHPLQAESVCWVTGRKDLLSGVFCLAATWVHLSAEASAGTAVNKRFVAIEIISTFLFIAALLSKPSAASWPIAVLGIDLLLLRAKPARAILRLLPWLAAAVVIVLLTSHVQQIRESVLRVYSSMLDRTIVAANSLVFYVRKFVVPVGLSPVYATPPKQLLVSNFSVLKLTAVMVAAVLFLRRPRSICTVSATIFVAALLPVLGFVHFAYQIFSTVADRYTYTALLGPCLAVSTGIYLLLTRFPRYSALVITGCAIILVIIASLAYHQSSFWQNDEALWNRAIKIAPTAPVAHANLAAYLGHSGRYADAIREVDQALALDPDYSVAYFNRAVLLSLQKDWTNSAAAARRAIQSDPSYAEAHYLLGSCLGLSGNLGEAIAEYKTALRLKPELLQARLDLAAAYSQSKRPAESEAELRKALVIAPASAEAHKRLGMLHAAQGRTNEAAAEFRIALRLDPASPAIAALLESTGPK